MLCAEHVELMAYSEENIILSKLDEFIRKYYKNQLIKGSIYTTGLITAFYLFVTTTEFFGEFGSASRMILFFLWMSSSLLVIIYYILIPLTKIYKLGSILSHENAAKIIGAHFHQIEDKLLNFIQLTEKKTDMTSVSLWEASINQKISALQPVPFTSAVNFRENSKYLKFLLIPFGIVLTLLFAAPSVLTEGTKRLVNYNKFYEKPAPFQFEIANKHLVAVQQDDFKVSVKITGTEVPAEVYINAGTDPVKIDKKTISEFEYTFRNVQKKTSFHFEANGFTSKEYCLEVVPKPTLTNFNLLLTYPAYLARKNETLSNIGDVVIPQGTKVQWIFTTKNSEFVKLSFSDSIVQLHPSGEDKFSFSRRFMSGGNYSVKTGNRIVKSDDSLLYAVNVIPDAFPTINLSEQKDSLKPKNIYFSGAIKDDYGFSALQFRYTHFSKDSSGKEIEIKKSVPLNLNKGQPAQAFYHFFDLNSIKILPGDKLEYFFEVTDNDGVNGTKTTKSSVMIFKVPTIDEVNKEVNQKNEKIEKEMQEAIKQAKDLQKQVNDLNKQVQEKKQLGWEEKKKIEELLSKQNELNKKIENFKQENQINNDFKNEFRQPNQELLNKQQELEKLMENIMTPEMKKLFDELQKLMEKMSDKQKIQETLEKMKMTEKDIEKELDRNLELFKQMDIEQKLDNAIKKLENIKKEQNELAEKTNPDKKNQEKFSDDKKNEIKKQLDDLKKQLGTQQNQNTDKKEELNKKIDALQKKLDELKKQTEENKQDTKTDNKSLQNQQEELSKKFNELKQDLKELESKNKELERPNHIPETENLQKEISQDQQQSENQLEQNNKKGSSKSQKNASEKMDQLQQQMESAQKQMNEEQEGEDMAAVRQLLENLLHLSFTQESLIEKTKSTKISDPNFVKLGQQQQKLKEDAKMVEDSLLSISKRQPKISASVNREINSIQMNMGKVIGSLEERNTYEASTRQQNIMTSINNLALMLNESMEQMQQQASKKNGNSKGGGSCKKPGSQGQKPNMGSMRKMQEALNKQLQEMKNAMEKGGQKPGQKPGNKPGQNGLGGLSSEQFAKMAAQQEALRKMLQDAMKKGKETGNNPGGDMAKMMEETETELVNKMITQQTIRRQQEILTRLLESEKAEQEREMDEKRESNESHIDQISNQKSFDEYKRSKEKELELLKTLPPSLTPFYKEKVTQYFNQYTP